MPNKELKNDEIPKGLYRIPKKVNQFRDLHLNGKRKDIDPCNKCGKTF